MKLKPWELAAYTLKDLFTAFEGWKEEQQDRWEQTRMICFYSGNHKADKPEGLFPLDIDSKRLENLIDSGKAQFATIRKQTPDEQLMMKTLGRK